MRSARQFLLLEIIHEGCEVKPYVRYALFDKIMELSPPGWKQGLHDNRLGLDETIKDAIPKVIA